MKYKYKVVTCVNDYLISCIAEGKYTLTYEIGKEVEAVKGSVGIMCFDTLTNAKKFRVHLRNRFWNQLVNIKILRVQPLVRATRCKYWTSTYGELALNNFYKFLNGKIHR